MHWGTRMVRSGMFQGSSAWHWIGAINKQALARIGSTKQRYITLCMARYWRPIYICEKAHARGGYMSRRSYRSKAQAHAIPSGRDHVRHRHGRQKGDPCALRLGHGPAAYFHASRYVNPLCARICIYNLLRCATAVCTISDPIRSLVLL